MADEAKPTVFGRLKRLLTSSASTPAQAVPSIAPSEQPAPEPTTPELGGMAGEAQKILKSRPYQLHLQEMKAMGQDPLTPQQFANTH